jgi:hypothetical protein
MGLRCLLRSWRKLHGEVGRIFNPFWIQLIPIENPKSEDLKALLQQVIALDQHRILSRLRSRHAERTRKTAGKQALIAQLNQVICDKSIKARLGFAKSRLTTVREGAQALQVLFTRLESILDPRAKEVEVQKVLGEIVKEAYEFTRENDLSIALQNFSGNPSLKNHLPEAIGKLARYYSAAFELVCAARDKFPRLPISKDHSKKSTPKYNFSSITSFTRIVHDQESSALVRAHVICAISSSASTEGSTFLGHMAGSTRNGSCQTG